MSDDKYLLKRVSDGEEFSLSFASQLIGRSNSCDILVKTGQASREHARIKAKDNGAIVEDLHSTNGTFVNDKRIEEATLIKPGDVVRFDQESFSLQRNDDSSNETIYARPISASAAGMSIEEQDEDDINSTVYRQSFVMPPGWSGFDEGQPTANDPSKDRKQQALDNYINKSFNTLKGKALIALILSNKDDPPIIKTVSTDEAEEQWSVGRNKSCDLVVEMPDISEVHCHLLYSQGQWSLEDNQSTNGIWYKNKKQPSINLNNGMSLHLASLKLDVRTESREA